MSEMARRRTPLPVHVLILTVLAIAIAIALMPVTNAGDMNDVTMINILTRTGTRQQCFRNLQSSIREQTHRRIRHILSVDVRPVQQCFQCKDCELIEVQKRTSGRCPYNAYLNELASRVDDGWVIILDDDARLIAPTFLENLSRECTRSDPNEILIYPILLGEGADEFGKGEIDMATLQVGELDMANFCAHRSVFECVQFTEECAGDFKFLERCHTAGYQFRFLDISVGIWANYSGPRNGEDRDCFCSCAN